MCEQYVRFLETNRTSTVWFEIDANVPYWICVKDIQLSGLLEKEMLKRPPIWLFNNSPLQRHDAQEQGFPKNCGLRWMCCRVTSCTGSLNSRSGHAASAASIGLGPMPLNVHTTPPQDPFDGRLAGRKAESWGSLAQHVLQCH